MVDGIYRACLIKKMSHGTSRKYGTLVLKTRGEKLSGSMFPLSFWLESPFRGGKVDGDRFEFTVNFASPCQQYEMTITGEVNGDRVSGKAATPMGEYELEGSRQNSIC